MSAVFPTHVRIYMTLSEIKLTVGYAAVAAADPQDPDRRNNSSSASGIINNIDNSNNNNKRIHNHSSHYKDHQIGISDLNHGHSSGSCSCSSDSECDLAALVHDFIENGGSGASDFRNRTSESGKTGNYYIANNALETLQALRFDAPPLPAEKELLRKLFVLVQSFKEADLMCHNYYKQDARGTAAECNGGCIRRLLVKHLRLSGYDDASICISKWSNAGNLPGGEYEYMEVRIRRSVSTSTTTEQQQLVAVGNWDHDYIRVIVDIDFASQFEIARPTRAYVAALKLLPVIFVGCAERLEKTLRVMADAAKWSLRHNAMPVPPWRSLAYMKAKWLSQVVYDDDGDNDVEACRNARDCEHHGEEEEEEEEEANGISSHGGGGHNIRGTATRSSCCSSRAKRRCEKQLRHLKLWIRTTRGGGGGGEGGY